MSEVPKTVNERAQALPTFLRRMLADQAAVEAFRAEAFQRSVDAMAADPDLKDRLPEAKASVAVARENAARLARFREPPETKPPADPKAKVRSKPGGRASSRGNHRSS